MVSELRRYVIGLGDADILRLERLASKYHITESEFIRLLLSWFEEFPYSIEEVSMGGEGEK